MYRETVGSDSLNFACKFGSKRKHFLKFDVHRASGKKNNFSEKTIVFLALSLETDFLCGFSHRDY